MARTCPDRGSIATAAPILPCGRRCARTAAARLGVQLPLQAQVEGEPQVGAGHRVLPLASAAGTPAGSTYRHCARRSRAVPRRTAARARRGRRSRPAAARATAPRRRAWPPPRNRAPARAGRPGIRPAGLRDDQHAGDRCRGDCVPDVARAPRRPSATAWCPAPRELGGQVSGRPPDQPGEAVESAGRVRSRAGPRAPGPAPLPTSTASTASGTPCRSVIEPRAAGSRKHRVICSLPTTGVPRPPSSAPASRRTRTRAGAPTGRPLPA